MDNEKVDKSSDNIPFQERVNVDLFFPGAQRRKILDELKNAIGEGVSVITLTGDEGTGKTMTCKMVEKELSSERTCVYLPNALESFDDVVRVIALKLDTDNSDKPELTTTLVSEIIENLQENDRQLVVVFDQSERMYLATIERIRKMIDQVNSDENRLQIIFSGRPSLLENLNQLKICDFGDIEEKDFALNPFGLSETYTYLNHCAQQRSPSSKRSVFTPDVAKKIFSMAQGNLRMTNLLASKSLGAAESDTSFMVQLDNVRGDEDLAEKVKNKTTKSKQLLNRKRLIYGGTGFIILFLFFLIFRGGEDSPETVVDTSQPVNKAVEVQKDIAQVDVKVSTPPSEQPTLSKKEEEKAASQVFNEPPEMGVISSQLVEETPEVEKATYQIIEETSEIIIVQKEDPVEQEKPEVAQKSQIKGIEQVTPKTILVDNKKKIVAEKSIEEEQLTSGSEPQTMQKEAETVSGNVVVSTPEENNIIAAAEEEVSLNSQNSQELIAADPEEAPTDDLPEVMAGEIEAPPEEQVAMVEQSQIALSPLSVKQTQEEQRIADPKNLTALEIDSASDAAAGQETTLAHKSQQSADTPETLVAVGEPEDQSGFQEVVILAEVKKQVPPVVVRYDNAKRIKKIAPVKLKSLSENIIPENTSQPIDLYQQRLAAGSGWYAQGNKDLHTVQLMVLTAELAEENLRKRFKEQEYQDIADKLYIIKNDNSKVFVYYGEFPDLDSARQARNTLPVFLRKHDPYAVSVKNAISKAGN